MSRTVRTWLLAGCCVIALLEARRASESLRVGLSGPYAVETPDDALRAELQAPTPPIDLAPILLLGPAHAPVAGALARAGR